MHDLKEKGVISEEDYQEAKDSLLRKSRSVGERLSTAVDDVSSDANLWSMCIHLSQLCGYAVPLAGMIVPVVLWQIKKADSELIDRHGRIVVNWIISELIYAVVFGVLLLIGIGIPLLLALATAGIVFPIIGGVKANNGEVWPYPLSITFFQLD